MKIIRNKLIGALLLGSTLLATSANAINGNSFNIVISNHMANNKALYFWSELVDGKKPGSGVVANGARENNWVIPVSLAKNVSDEVRIVDSEGNLVWKGVINFHSLVPAFDFEAHSAPKYNVNIKGYPDAHLVTIDVSE